MMLNSQYFIQNFYMNLLSSADGSCPAWLKMTLAAAKQCRDSIKHCWEKQKQQRLSLA